MEATPNVLGLIEKATDSTGSEVDFRLLKAIKFVVRESKSELRLAAHTLIRLMKRDHSQVRYLTLLIIDELFMRSKLFRTILTVDLHEVLNLAVGFRSNTPLPNPPEVAARLRSKAIQVLDKWNTCYGVYYRQIRLGFHHINTTLRLGLPGSATSSDQGMRRRTERAMKSKQILLSRLQTLKQNLPSLEKEIQSTASELEECLHLLLSPKNLHENPPPDFFAAEQDEDEGVAEFRSSELRQIRLGSLREGEMVRETGENRAVFDTLRELYKLSVFRHLVSVQEAVSVLIRVDAEEEEDCRFRDSALKDLIDMKNRIRFLKNKCEQECGISAAEFDDCGGWEDGRVIPTARNRKGEKKEEKAVAKEKGKAPERGEVASSSAAASSSSLKNELLSEAPVLKWGSFLDDWGSNREVRANNRGLDIQGHWGRVDYDAVIPAGMITGLNFRATLYEEGGGDVEMAPCRARLRKGGLCQRRDVKQCPFHGTVVPRNEEGDLVTVAAIVDRSSSSSSAKELEPVGSAGEGDGAKKKKVKRALATAHNECVLRAASMASWGSPDGGGGDGAEEGRKKVKKETLASMLRKKKPTARERLSLRLLNGQAGDAAVEHLKSAEELGYRQAFLNQW